MLLATLWTARSWSGENSSQASKVSTQLSFRVAGARSTGMGVLSQTTHDLALDEGPWDVATRRIESELDESRAEKEGKIGRENDSV